MTMIEIILLALVLTNLTSFCLMAYDKHCAKVGKWRIPEKTLFIAAACFGGLGGVLGMQICHHKTRHWYFKWLFPSMLLAQAAILLLVFQHLPQ